MGKPAFGLEKRDILFYASFDKDLNADIALGSRAPTIKGKKTFQLIEGLKGKGVLVNHPDTFLWYETKGNYLPDEGTISLWAKSVDWKNPDGNFHLFFQTVVERDRILYTYYGGGYLAFYFGAWSGKAARTTCGAPWKPGEWHHLVATWSKQKKEIAVYFDGTEHLKKNAPDFIFPLVKAKKPNYFSIGPRFRWRHISGKADTIIDEFYIFKKALSYSEISSLYKKGVDFLPSKQKAEK